LRASAAMSFAIAGDSTTFLGLLSFVKRPFLASEVHVIYWDLVSPQRPPSDVRRYSSLPERVLSCLAF